MNIESSNVNVDQDPTDDAQQDLAQRISAAGSAEGNNTMKLTAAEIRRAWEIKRAVEDGMGAEDLEHPVMPLKDFEYVQYALFCPHNDPIPNILHRISMVQACRREYGFINTVEQGLEILELGTQLLPGFLLAIEYLKTSENYMCVEDWSKLYPAVVRTDEQYRIFVGMYYYKLHCQEPQFTAIRNGTTSIVECTDMTLQENFDSTFTERVLHSFKRWYPNKRRETFCVNAPSIIPFWYGMTKKFLPGSHQETIKFGFQVPGMEGQRIDPLYKMPTPELAIQKMLRNARCLLTLRYHNEKTFVLPPLPAGP